ncbi:MAG: transcriptional regulator NrdR [Oscillospiraceae bacterium]|nr:transcriptional regulator NrdR [Oscillospiraceae bacterium]
MKCPYCGNNDSKVVDSRPTDEGESIRRRRECLSCAKRFTTYENIESLPLMVVKKDGSRQSFNRQKLQTSMLKACDKRAVSIQELDRLATEIEQTFLNALEREVSTVQIGDLVMERLKNVDKVAYVRFASVYRDFTDVRSFLTELTKLVGEK